MVPHETDMLSWQGDWKYLPDFSNEMLVNAIKVLRNYRFDDRFGRYTPMATRSTSAHPVPSQIDWPIVGVAGATAGLFITCMILTAWVAGKQMRSMNLASSSRVAVPELPASQEMESVPPAAANDSNDKGGNDKLPAALSPARSDKSDQREAAWSGLVQSLLSALTKETKDQGAQESSAASSGRKEPTEPVCQASAVSVEFAKDPLEAALLAKQEHKLMFVLHVSGNFEESKFT
jgi:hypothetical protein